MNRTLLRILNLSGLRMIFKDLMKIYSRFNVKSNNLLMLQTFFFKYQNMNKKYQNIDYKYQNMKKSIKIWIKSIKIWIKSIKIWIKSIKIIENILYKKVDLLIFLSWSMLF